MPRPRSSGPTSTRNSATCCDQARSFRSTVAYPQMPSSALIASSEVVAPTAMRCSHASTCTGCVMSRRRKSRSCSGSPRAKASIPSRSPLSIRRRVTPRPPTVPEAG